MTIKNPAHPSAILRECLDDTGWSISEFADKLQINTATATQLLNGHCEISSNVAVALEQLGWSDAEFWLRCQANYDLAQARRAPEPAPRANPPA